jgi:hypothetical protein
MFEKWRIKEHMDVTDSTGRHVGTVDEIEDNRIKLTRSDSSDGSHHYIDIDSVESIEDNRVTLKAGTSLPDMGRSADQLQSTSAGGSAAEGQMMGGQAANTGGSPAANQAVGNDADNYSRNTSAANPPSGEDRALFGTSGQGTGMGGSGSGTEN